MIDISSKKPVERIASAGGTIRLRKSTIESIRKSEVKKGDVLTVARVAGLGAVKQTWAIIPYCHQIPVEAADISFEINEDRILVRCEVSAFYKTGVEMEALAGASVALLTVWDMVKYLEKDDSGNYPETDISEIRVLSKTKMAK